MKYSLVTEVIMEPKKTNSSLREATVRALLYDIERTFEEDYPDEEPKEQEEVFDWAPAWQPYSD
jgi:hypothetical protein